MSLSLFWIATRQYLTTAVVSYPDNSVRFSDELPTLICVTVFPGTRHMNSSKAEGPDGSPMLPDELVGLIIDVPDKWWGFEAADRTEHPGACVREAIPGREYDMLKGVGGENRDYYHATEVLVVPSEANGLSKNTLFSVKPRPMRRHKLRNLAGKVRGRLSDNVLDRLRREMIRQFGIRRTQ